MGKQKHRHTAFQVSLYLVLQPVFLVTSESAVEMHVTWPLLLGGFDQNHRRHYRRRLHPVLNLVHESFFLLSFPSLLWFCQIAMSTQVILAS
jgi:hypothetical protein